jgi:hypothetical protein
MAEKAKTVVIDYSVPSAALSLHEPVVLLVKVRNNGAESITLRLGRDRKTGYNLGLTPPGKTHMTLTNPEPRGIYDKGDVSVPAGGTFTQRLLLNEWYDFSTAGKYFIDIRMMEPPRAGNSPMVSARDSGFRGSFEIGLRNSAKIRAACERLASEIKNASSYAEWAEAAAELSYVGDPVAVAYLQQAMDQQPMVAYTLADGLAKVGNDAAVEALLTELVNSHPSVADAARNALIGIQDAIPNQNLRETVKRTLSKESPARSEL